jgi:hypothetical protein
VAITAGSTPSGTVGAVTITGGTQATAGGAVTLAGGDGGATGGKTIMNSGTGTTTGGDAEVNAGPGPTGGAVKVTTAGSATSGGITLQTGVGPTASGSVLLSSGSAGGPGTASGGMYLISGAASKATTPPATSVVAAGDIVLSVGSAANQVQTGELQLLGGGHASNPGGNSVIIAAGTTTHPTTVTASSSVLIKGHQGTFTTSDPRINLNKFTGILIGDPAQASTVDIDAASLDIDATTTNVLSPGGFTLSDPATTISPSTITTTVPHLFIGTTIVGQDNAPDATPTPTNRIVLDPPNGQITVGTAITIGPADIVTPTTTIAPDAITFTGIAMTGKNSGTLVPSKTIVLDPPNGEITVGTAITIGPANIATTANFATPSTTIAPGSITTTVPHTFTGTTMTGKNSGTLVPSKTIVLDPPNGKITIGGSGISIGPGTTITATTFSGAVTGNADTATTLATARTIAGVPFNGGAPINIPSTGITWVNTPIPGTTITATFSGPLTGDVTGDVSGSSGSTTGNAGGNAATATTLATARTIAGVPFNGGAPINIPSTGITYNGNVDFGAHTFTIPTGGSFSVEGGTVYWNGDVLTKPSDRQLKTDLRPIDDALDKVMSIRGVYYNWQDNPQYVSDGVIPLDETERKRRNVGLIAQDLQQVLPEAVSSNGEDDQYLGVDYGSLSALLIEAMKEMHARMEMLEDDVDELMNQRRA